MDFKENNESSSDESTLSEQEKGNAVMPKSSKKLSKKRNLTKSVSNKKNCAKVITELNWNCSSCKRKFYAESNFRAHRCSNNDDENSNEDEDFPDLENDPAGESLSKAFEDEDSTNTDVHKKQSEENFGQENLK